MSLISNIPSFLAPILPDLKGRTAAATTIVTSSAVPAYLVTAALSTACLIALADLVAYGELARSHASWQAGGTAAIAHAPETIAALELRGLVLVIERCRRHFFARLTRRGRLEFAGAAS